MSTSQSTALNHHPTRADLVGRYRSAAGEYKIEANSDVTKVSVLGTDCGGAQWRTCGQLTRELLVDFSPRGGQVETAGKVMLDGGIRWPDGSAWEKVSKTAYPKEFLAMHNVDDALSQAINLLLKDDTPTDPLMRLSEILAKMAQRPQYVSEKKEANAANQARRRFFRQRWARAASSAVARVRSHFRTHLIENKCGECVRLAGDVCARRAEA